MRDGETGLAHLFGFGATVKHAEREDGFAVVNRVTLFAQGDSGQAAWDYRPGLLGAQRFAAGWLEFDADGVIAFGQWFAGRKFEIIRAIAERLLAVAPGGMSGAGSVHQLRLEGCAFEDIVRDREFGPNFDDRGTVLAGPVGGDRRHKEQGRRDDYLAFVGMQGVAPFHQNQLQGHVLAASGDSERDIDVLERRASEFRGGLCRLAPGRDFDVDLPLVLAAVKEDDREQHQPRDSAAR